MATPSKFTAGRLTVLLQTLREAGTRTAAAARAEINFDTFAEWLKDEDRKLPSKLTLPPVIEGEEESVYPAGTPFKEAVIRAEGEAEQGLISRVRKAALDHAKVTYFYDRNGNLLREVHEYDWRAAAWLAEHNPQHRKNWAAPKGVEISGPDGGPVKTDGRSQVVFEPDAAYLKALGQAAAAEGDDDGSEDSGDR